MAGSRQCPLCDEPTDASLCPTHGLPTVRVEGFGGAYKPVRPGVVLGGRYQIEDSLGTGAAGLVFRATQLGMRRTVAVKVIRPDRVASFRRLQRFYQEANAVIRLQHPNIVAVIDFGYDEEHGTPYLVMEFARGETLERHIESAGPMPEARALAIVVQLARALVEAHLAGIVHRDLKPANLLVSRLGDGQDHLQVVDFGIAKVLHDDSLDGFTAPGTILGSPLFMSPEQAQGLPAGPKADVYSLGCILYYALAGRPPFPGTRVTDVLASQISDPPPPLPGRLAGGRPPSPALGEWMSRLLEKGPEARPDAAAAAQALAAILRGERPAPPRAASIGGDPTEGFTVVTQVKTVAAELGESAPTNPGLDRPDDQEHTVTKPGARPDQPARAALFSQTIETPPEPASGVREPPPGVREPSSDPRATLASAPSVQITPASPAPAWLRPVVGLGLAAALATIWVLRPRSETIEVRPAPVVAPAPVVSEPVAATARRVRIESVPRQARVFRDAKSLGETPLPVELDPARPIELVLRKEGFDEKHVTVPSDAPETLSVTLDESKAPQRDRTSQKRALPGSLKKAQATPSEGTSNKNKPKTPMEAW